MLKRWAIFGTSLWDFVAVVLATILLPIFAAKAETTNNLSDAELQGRALAQKLLAQWPEKDFTNTGILKIRGENDQRRELPVTCETTVNATGWQTRYEAKYGTNDTDVITLIVTHVGTETNRYLAFEDRRKDNKPSFQVVPHVGMGVSGNRTMIPFAGSDFWLCDLGLEFFHWPQQKVLPKTTNLKRGREYTLLESINPNPTTNGYTRVVSWIDKESGGILEAEAYDAAGHKLKDFYPKSLEKVNGQYQVQSMIMENSQTGSKSVFEFDLGK